MTEKLTLRKSMKTALKGLKQDDMTRQQDAVNDLLTRFLAAKGFRRALFYVPIQNEISPMAAMERFHAGGGEVYLPVCTSRDEMLVKKWNGQDCADCDAMGVPAPLDGELLGDMSALDCVIVPALAFTSIGARLGRGAGFYDKFLNALPESVLRIGLAWNQQVLPRIPLEYHDAAVNIVLFENAHIHI
ncbi:MAG: 5-formyltetrahydrofolate cyclo-ligase [Christensenellales bacterium]|jgi:5-formyltetrahydrofolate cyclo-ligase